MISEDIKRQEAHHREMTFEQEFIALIGESGGCVRSAIHIRVKVLCRASGALFFCGTTHDVAVGYPLVAPDGARARTYGQRDSVVLHPQGTNTPRIGWH